MSGIYVAIARCDGAYLMVGGMSLSLAQASPGPDSGLADGRGFAETGFALVRRAFRSGCTLILRSAAGPDGFRSSLLVVKLTQRREDEDSVAAVIDEGASLLKRWQPAVLDRPALDRALEFDPAWEIARAAKPALSLSHAGCDVPLLSRLNTAPGVWSPLLVRGGFVLDIGLFPLGPNREQKVLETAAQSKVLAGYSDPHKAQCLRDNAAAAALAGTQRVFAGLALTLMAHEAPALLADGATYQHSLRGPGPGAIPWSTQPEADEVEPLIFLGLDYTSESAELTSLEPDVRKPFELAVSLGSAWHGNRVGTDPLEYLLHRVEMIEQRIGARLDELREALAIVRVNTETALAHVRRTSERIVKQHFLKHFPHRKKNPPPLNDMIEELRKQGKIPTPVYSLMHTVRIFGNTGAHDTDYKVKDLGVVIESLCSLMEWHVTEEARVSAPVTSPD